MTCWGKFFFQQ